MQHFCTISHNACISNKKTIWGLVQLTGHWVVICCEEIKYNLRNCSLVCEWWSCVSNITHSQCIAVLHSEKCTVIQFHGNRIHTHKHSTFLHHGIVWRFTNPGCRIHMTLHVYIICWLPPSVKLSENQPHSLLPQCLLFGGHHLTRKQSRAWNTSCLPWDYWQKKNNEATVSSHPRLCWNNLESSSLLRHEQQIKRQFNGIISTSSKSRKPVSTMHHY